MSTTLAEEQRALAKSQANQFINPSGLRPLGRAVLIRPYEAQKKSSSIVLPDAVRSRELMVETLAVVVAVGPECWVDERQPRAKPGDHVIVTRYAGYMAKGILDGEQYRLVNDADIYCGVPPQEAV